MGFNLKKIKYKNLGFFRFKKMEESFLLTNDAGGHVFLNEPEFRDFLEGKLDEKKEPYLTLAKNNFVKNKADVGQLAEKYAQKKNFLFSGPSLHIMVVTLRCDNKCLYCHASAEDMRIKGTDMIRETAKKSLDIIFKTTSQYVAIEFQGGEPLANWPVVKFIIEEARKINKKAKKNLELRLVSNFNLMTKDKFEILIKNDVSLCTSLDGPAEIHNKNRPYMEKKDRDSHKAVEFWTKYFRQVISKLKKKGYKQQINAITTVSRFSLAHPEKIVDEYLRLGYTEIFLRPLNPFGFSKKAWGKIGYDAGEYLAFYKKALDYIIELNRQGVAFEEKSAGIYLKKILSEYDPNMLELRSPCGAGIGQLAYNWNGDVYTCDEGRMLSMMGDENFKLGRVEDGYRKLIDNATVKTVCSASCLDTLPGCSDCAYLPYCGTCPIYNYTEQGNIFGQMPTNDRCKMNMAILDHLFEKMRDKKIKAIFEKWLKK